VSADACDAMKAKGAQVFGNTQELAKNSQFVLTMLPNNDIVTRTYEEMIKDGVNSSTLFVDSSTVDPGVSQYVQKIVSNAGGSFVDAPVSGGVMGAQNATLTFMVGGTKEEFERVKGFLEGRYNTTFHCNSFASNNTIAGMGKRITYCGATGMGEAAKICNNMMLAISMIGTAETMNLAIRLGLDPKVFNEIINSSTGRSWASEINNPVPGLNPTAPPSANYAGGFSTALITKDLGLASSVGKLIG
jgi:3-hydroxyisobutyrate/3-hydroxypropionate dehydrogenase